MKNTIFLVFVMLINLLSAQENKEVIFTIDNQPVYTDEFVRIYKKNIDLVQDESQKNIDEYLQLYIDYKLKVLQAEELGLNKKDAFLKEYAGYKKQLAKSYLTDSNATESLVKEAYNRKLKQVKAKHILVMVSEVASPQDTLKALKQIEKIRKDALKNGFDATMKKVHNGKTVYAEDLGYFSVFRMVYPFETAAYTTKPGEISEPIRTSFGYHIIKTEDVIDNPGEIEVEHIMIATSDKDDADKKMHAKQRIDDVYAQLKNGANFEELARMYSEDKVSAKNGGNIGKFGMGKISSKAFEEAAFALNSVGEYSKPIKTDFGWHIIKLVKKYPIGSYEDEKRDIELAIKDDSRSKYITKAFVDKLKEQYNFEEDQKGMAYVHKVLNDDLKKKGWTYDKNAAQLKTALFVIDDKETVTVGEFLNWIEFRQRRAVIEDVNTFFALSYQLFIQQEILEYREEHLAEQNVDYANIINEYRDGLLLFDLMQVQIWDKAKTDTVGLDNFYKEHIKDYQWKKRATVSVAVCSDEKIAKKVRKLLKKGNEEQTIKDELNTNDRINVIFTDKTVEVGDDVLPTEYAIKKGVSSVLTRKPNEFVVVKAWDVKEPGAKSLEDAKGKVISDYQQLLEKEWLASLRNGHKIVVNQEVLAKVKAQVKL